MKYLKRVEAVTKLDKVMRNELEVENLLENVGTQKLKWFGRLNHVEIINSETKIQNKTNKIRPTTTWDNKVAIILNDQCTTWEKTRRNAKDAPC